MGFRVDFAIFLLFTAVSVLSASSERSGNLKIRKISPPKLSDNIEANPFLQNRITTTEDPKYERNLFLLSSSKRETPQYGNGSEHHNHGSNKRTPEVFENNEVNAVTYINNPFLQGALNAPNVPTNTVSSNHSNLNTQEPSTQKPRVEEYLDTETRTKSEIKCDEYSRQISGTTEVLSLVGTNSEVIIVDNEKCRKTNRLIVGGTSATPDEFPHMVALGRRTANGDFSFSCGGSLISPEWVLTAAHCTYGPKSPTDAKIGFHTLSDNQHGILTTINAIIRHPSYRPPAMYADIAVVKLNTVITFTRQIRPACLYQLYDTVPSQAWVSGWGVTEFGGEQSDQLQKALLDTVNNIACTIRHNRSIVVPYGVSPSMICAGDPREGWNKDTCQGDSGGPLQVIHPKNLCLFQVIGITSFGQGCAIVDSPGVYTRVSHYLNWIEDIVWPEA